MTVALEIPWSEAECRAWIPREEIKVSEWADNYRVLDARYTAEPGPWRTDRVPFLREIMDAFCAEEVVQITLRKCARIGGSECVDNMVAWAIDQNPTPTMFVLPRDVDGKTRLLRIKTMIEVSPRLRQYRPEAKTDWKTEQLFVNGMDIYAATAQSAAALGDKTIGVIVLDEVGKFPPQSGDEADPVNLAKERTMTYSLVGRKVVATSSPVTSGDLICREFDISDQRQLHVQCRFCKKYQALEFSKEKLRIPKDERDPDIIEQEQLATWRCKHCKKELKDTEENRIMLIESGVWVPKGCRITKAGRILGKPKTAKTHRGYQLNRLMSPWTTWSAVMATFLRSMRHRSALRNFHNSWLGLPFDEVEKQVEESAVMRCILPYAAGTVPEGAVVLTAGVDVQARQFYYVIRAWGALGRSWLVERGVTDNWKALEHLLFRRTFPVVRVSLGEDPVLLEDAEPLPVSRVCIDSGYDADEVYRFCRRHLESARPVKGRDTLGGTVWRLSPVDKDRRGQRILHGLNLYHLDTDYLKTKLYRLVAEGTEPADGWAVHLDPGEAYCRQVTSEELVVEQKGKLQKRVWKVKAGHENHWLDTEVYALAAAEMLHIFETTPEELGIGPDEEGVDQGPDRREAEEVEQSRRRIRRTGPGWIRGRKR